MSKKFFSPDENQIICQRIRENIPIQDYAASRGFNIIKKGSYYAIEGKAKNADFSSVMIRPSTNRYCRFATENRWKSIIDFVQELDNCDIATAINTLKPFVDTYDLEKAEIHKMPKQLRTKRSNSEMELPCRADTSKNVYAYLTKTRCINRDIVDNFIWNGQLYQDEYNNCVFVGYNRQGKAVFCNKRGTNTFAKNRFMWEHPDNDYRHCFFIDNGADTLIVNEGIIDTMSVMSIMQDRGRKINSYDYVALTGTGKWDAVINILSDNPSIKNVVLACDNDEAGFKAMENIKQAVSNVFPNVKVTDFMPKTEKDWNAQLQLIRNQGISTEEYLRLTPDELLSKYNSQTPSSATANRLSLFQSELDTAIELTKAGGALI